ncbi:MAG: hypothetical protein Q7S81_00630 [bacterium]|nr:hypothetical protein [bacterium]
MKILIRIVLGIALVGAAGYFLFGKSNTFSYKMPNLGLSENNIVSMATTTVGNIKNRVSDTFSGFTDELQTKAEEMVSSSINNAKNYVFDVFKQGVEDGVNKLGEKAGITSVNINSADTAIDNPIVYPVKKGINASFIIRNSGEDTLKYKVDWLDGNSNSGELTKKDQSVVLNHKWVNAGEYLINFNITNSAGTKIYKVSISVLN